MEAQTETLKIGLLSLMNSPNLVGFDGVSSINMAAGPVNRDSLSNSGLAQADVDTHVRGR